MDPKVPNRSYRRGLQTGHWRNPGSYSKKRTFGPKSENFGQKKRIHFLTRVWAKQKNENYGLYRNFLMAPGSHICMFKYSFVAWKISSLNIFCVFVFLFRAHFRISCMSEINMQESKSKFWNLLYFSHISIDWFQIFACLVQECESEIMFSVSTLSTLKYLQKKKHFLNDSTENFACSSFPKQIFFLSL